MLTDSDKPPPPSPRRRVVWTPIDTVLLVATLCAACVLTTTMLVVWRPHAETTNNFRPATCMVLNLFATEPQRCTSGPPFDSADCTVSTTSMATTTIASSTLPTMSVDALLPIAAAQSSTSGAVDVGRQCSWFPCKQVVVQYALSVADGGRILVGVGQLYSNHTQLQTYPGCSYSACDGTTYNDNKATIQNALNQWVTKLHNGQSFACYIDGTGSTTSSVLLQVEYSWTAAFNSIFWPTVCCGICLLTLICHVICNNVKSCRCSSAAGNNDTRLPSVHYGRWLMTSSTERQLAVWNHAADDTNDGLVYGIHPTQSTINDEDRSASLDPPPYWQLAPSCEELHNQSPPTYQSAVNSGATVDDE